MGSPAAAANSLNTGWCTGEDILNHDAPVTL
jgi:hypothetical protein